MKRVLIITYYWPPSGGAGVQRWLKFSRYLPEFGWEPVIMTVDPQYAAYPVTDNSLVNDIPGSLRVITTPATDYFSIYKKDRSRIPAAGFANSAENSLKNKILRFIRGNFFIPDPRKGWNSYAFRKACSLLEEENIEHVITTSPPHSTQLIGLKLKKRYPSVKWIADLRDPWTDIYYYSQFYHTTIARYIDSWYERKTLLNADRIITVGESLKESFCARAGGIEEKTNVVTNGYDESDFKNVRYSPCSEFTISYTGTLSDAYPVQSFLDATAMFISKGKTLKIRFIGTVSPKQTGLIEKTLPENVTSFIPYVDHDSVIKYMMESDVLLLIIPDHKSNRSIITGKLFEYIASGKPVICLGPVDGDASVILRKSGKGKTFGYSDSEGTARFLEDISNKTYAVSESSPLTFSRRMLSEKLASLLSF
ncbi:MAG TPA: glycosyltransferase family 4 protein [Bacteroidales bacterium]|nr:glycosyltransferase family 4 protein [Bacteroidales bacterium]